MAGDVDRVRAAVSLLYRRVLDDPTLAPYFRDVDLLRVARHQRAFLAAALGGSVAYNGQDLRAAHAHLKLSGAQVDVMMEYALGALRDVGVSKTGVQAAARRLESVRHLIVGDV